MSEHPNAPDPRWDHAIVCDQCQRDMTITRSYHPETLFFLVWHCDGCERTVTEHFPGEPVNIAAHRNPDTYSEGPD